LFQAPDPVWTHNCAYKTDPETGAQYFYTILGETGSSTALNTIHRYDLTEGLWSQYLALDTYIASISTVLLDN
jgi:hypothetical protein